MKAAAPRKGCRLAGIRTQKDEGYFMRKSQLMVGLLAGASMALLAAGPANAQSALGPYLFAGLGYDQMPDRNLTISGRPGVSSQWKPGYGVLAGVGYKWFFGLRTEGEYSGRVSWVKTFNGTAPWAGTAWDNSVMVNALYDFEFDSPITPFIGGGIGLNQIQWGNNFRVPTQNPPTIYDGESIRPGWQGIGGVSWAITPQIAVAVDGRIKGSFGHFNFFGSVPPRSITQFNYETRSIFISVRYFFGG
jgi:opacity protein-like surface antigen